MLDKIFEKSGTADIIISILFIILGIFLIVETELITSLISIVIGGLCLVIGIIRVVSYIKEKSENSSLLSTSILLIISGIVIMFFTHIILDFFRIGLSIWIIYTGVMNIIRLVSWKEYKSKLWITTLILALILLGIGLYMLFSPNAIMQTIGIVVIVYGVIDIIANVIFIGKIKQISSK